jgi:hypothetical protein
MCDPAHRASRRDVHHFMRDRCGGENLNTLTKPEAIEFNHEGVPTGESSFCGGDYENGPRKDYKPNSTPTSARRCIGLSASS